MIHLILLFTLGTHTIEAEFKDKRFDTLKQCSDFIESPQFNEVLREALGFFGVSPDRVRWTAGCKKDDTV